MPLSISINNRQKVQVTLTPNDGGTPPRPVDVDGVPSWEVVNGDSTIEPSEDGKSAQLVSSDDPGDTQILVKADADLGDGVVEISDIIQLTVTGAQAQSLGLTVGTPEPK